MFWENGLNLKVTGVPSDCLCNFSSRTEKKGLFWVWVAPLSLISTKWTFWHRSHSAVTITTATINCTQLIETCRLSCRLWCPWCHSSFITDKHRCYLHYITFFFAVTAVSAPLVAVCLWCESLVSDQPVDCTSQKALLRRHNTGVGDEHADAWW